MKSPNIIYSYKALFEAFICLSLPTYLCMWLKIIAFLNEGRDIYTSAQVFDCRLTKNIFDKMFTELRGKGY